MKNINGYVMVHENVNTSIEIRVSIIALSIQFLSYFLFFYFSRWNKVDQFICTIYMENFLSHRA